LAVIIQMGDKGELGEKIVNDIVSKTYLKYWCFPNPKHENSDKKEICDLLILFKNTIIIVSVKNYDFKGKYERYFRNTLNKAISQIQGAERKLFKSNIEVIFNHPLKGEFLFDSDKYDTLHRIIVNINNEPLFYPGGSLNKNNDFVHVFNQHAFEELVKELDTIPDLIQYLNCREETFCNKELLFMTGEENDWTVETNQEFINYKLTNVNQDEKSVLISGTELDLLANYYYHERSFSKEIHLDEANHAFIQLDQNFNKYLNDNQVKLKKEHDEESYLIDKLIEQDILYYNQDNRIEMATELLALSRFERRIAGSHFKDFLEMYQGHSKYFTAKRFGTYGELALGYFIHSDDIPIETVMNLMQLLVLGYSHWENYKSKRVLVIGINTGRNQTKFSYDPNVEVLSGQEKQDLIKDLKLLNWFQNLEKKNFNFKEYPEK